jgi:dolichyl-phosphate-mannose-protein mannosyltransferase
VRRSRLARRPGTAVAVLGGALGLWLATGVGFVNYDTLYSLVWGQQLTRGEVPAYKLALAPTPHPLLELLGVLLGGLSAHVATAATITLAFLALSACAWALYRLGSHWFGRAAGVVAAAVLLTRVPILSYGVRAYADIPFVLFVLLALLVETERPRAGAPVLALLALAGLLRPEAWGLSVAYLLYLGLAPRLRPRAPQGAHSLALLALLALSAPAVWLASDLLATGNPLWSLLNTRSTAHQLHRITGITNVPEYIPRRIGEILRPSVLAGAALGGVLSLAWLGPRARLGAAAGALAVAVLATSAAFGLPIDTRYAFLAAAILCVFCGAGTFGWMALQRGRRRRVWMALGMLTLVGLLASLPGQLEAAHHELSVLARQQAIQDDLVALAGNASVSHCGPVEVPSHAPIPLLALYLQVPPARIAYATTHPIQQQSQPIQYGSYLQPASVQVEHEYVLGAPTRTQPGSIPAGFQEARANRSWLLFERCG